MKVLIVILFICVMYCPQPNLVPIGHGQEPCYCAET